MNLASQGHRCNAGGGLARQGARTKAAAADEAAWAVEAAVGRGAQRRGRKHGRCRHHGGRAEAAGQAVVVACARRQPRSGARHGAPQGAARLPTYNRQGYIALLPQVLQLDYASGTRPLSDTRGHQCLMRECKRRCGEQGGAAERTIAIAVARADVAVAIVVAVHCAHTASHEVQDACNADPCSWASVRAVPKLAQTTRATQLSSLPGRSSSRLTPHPTPAVTNSPSVQ